MIQENEVNTAFEILLEEIELVANQLNEEGAQAFKQGEYDKARRAIEEATRLADFREKVKALQKEWASLLARGHSARRRQAARSKAACRGDCVPQRTLFAGPFWRRS